MVTITRPDGTTLRYRDIIGDDPDDVFFVKIINEFAPHTMTTKRGLEPAYAVFKGIQYLTRNRIPGDFVECGVWRGGTVILMALALKYFGDTDRKIYLYDTFDGMTPPGNRDVDWTGTNYQVK